MIALLLLAAAVPSVTVQPSAADPRVRQFDDPSVVLAGPKLTADAPLAIFLAGTGGKPGGPQELLQTIAAQGYRVIALSYNNAPAVLQVCARDPDPACSARFREVRSLGSGSFAAQPNAPAEAIVPRLVATLRYLARTQPGQGWEGYLAGDQPRWDRLVIGGLSQGAGMAAFIAKRHPLRRVVLSSSPWDFTGPERRPAPWLAAASATPPERWYAAYNARENAAALLRAAYRELRIPAAHIRVMDRDLPRGATPRGPNPYHAIGIRDPRYLPLWRALYGRGG